VPSAFLRGSLAFGGSITGAVVAGAIVEAVTGVVALMMFDGVVEKVASRDRGDSNCSVFMLKKKFASECYMLRVSVVPGYWLVMLPAPTHHHWRD
jgi:hypothetical protein